MAILTEAGKEYLNRLIPEDPGDWKAKWEQGYEKGKKIERMETPFHRKYGVKNDADLRMRYAKEGKMTWQINIGLGTMEDQIECLQGAEKWMEENGLDIQFSHQLPDTIIGCPADRREGLPHGVGYPFSDDEKTCQEEYIKLAQCSCLGLKWEDNHIGDPNAVEATIHALTAGTSYTGLIGTWQQITPGCPDETWNMLENVEAMGICAAKYDEKVIVNSNMDDSLPAYCVDLATYLAWAKMERYIVEDLCKCRYSFSFGNLTVDMTQKAAMWLAASDAFKKDDQPGIEFIYPDTVSAWDHALHSNYGYLVPETLMCCLVERKYKTGASMLLVPITEKVAIPQLKNMVDMAGAAIRSDEAAEWYSKIINWEPIETLRDQIQEFSDVMYNNVMEGMKEAGVDITNPVEIMVVTKKMNPAKFEELFHPSVVQDGLDRVKPMLPAALWEETIRQADEVIEQIKDEPYVKKLKGKRYCLASGDVHYFGYIGVLHILEHFGAEVIEGGPGVEAVDILDVADEFGCPNVIVSLHNGYSLTYGTQLKKIADERGKKYNMILGGMITEVVGDDIVPSDVTPQLTELGMPTSTDFVDLIQQISEWEE